MSIKSQIIDKLIFPLLEKIFVAYVNKAFLTSQKRFSSKEKKLQLYEKRTLEILRRVRIRPANSRSATEQAVGQITEALSTLLRHDINAQERKFGINFLDQYTKDLTIEEMMKALGRIDPRDLACVVKAVAAELDSDPAVKLISTRDVFQDVVSTLEAECKECLQETHLLEQQAGHKDDRRSYMTEKTENDFIYEGVDPEISNKSLLFEEMRNIQKSMKDICRKTARQKCSRTHIVMSVALGNGWLQNSDSQSKYIVITAGKTDKTDLLIPSQTPVVAKLKDKWVYYGDASAKPSSEALSHWSMHEGLSGMTGEWSNLRSIFHAHLVDIIDVSRKYLDQSEFPLGNKLVPNVDWLPHGTVRLGKKIVAAIVAGKSKIAVVKQHGPWFFEPTLEEAYDRAMRTVDSIRSIR